VYMELAPRLATRDALDAPCGKVVLVSANLGEVSSSQIRARLARRDFAALHDLVPSPVLEFIRHHGLYLP